MRYWITTIGCTVFLVSHITLQPQSLHAQTQYHLGDMPNLHRHDSAAHASKDPDGTDQHSKSMPAHEIGHQYVPPVPVASIPALDEAADPAPMVVGQPVSLDELLAIACAHNPTLKQANAHITAEMGKAIQAGLYPNPVIRYSAEQIGVEGTAGEFHGGIISQEIVRGGKLQLSRAKFLQRVQAAEALAVAQQFRVSNDVAIRYYQLLALKQQIQIQTELVKSYEDHAVTTREAYQMGQANNAALRKSNVDLRQSSLKLLALQNHSVQMLRSLAAVVGTDLESVEGTLEGIPKEVQFDGLLYTLYETSPEILAANAKLEGDRLTIQREEVEPISNLNLEGGAGYNFETGETVAVAGVSFRLPIFDRNQGTIQQARADMARQCAEIARIQAKLKQDLSMEFQNYETASQYLQQYRDFILPDLREAYRLTLESYRENRETWENVLANQQEYYQARMQYVDWLAKWRQSEVLLDGMLLRGGLTAAENPTPNGHIDSVPKPR